MANRTPEEIAEKIAAMISAVEGSGAVLTDKRFAQSNEELVPLLISQSEEGAIAGWIIVWNELPLQQEESDCQSVATYRFELAHLFGYLNDDLEKEISDIVFKGNIFKGNEALNKDRYLGFTDNIVKHLMLQSSAPFDLIDYAHNGANRLAHIALFTLDVEVTNSYGHTEEE